MSAENHDRISLNGTIMAAIEARISPLSDGFMYGHGLFETIKVVGGRLAFFEEHADRLHRGATELGLSFSASSRELRSRCDAVIEANGLVEGSLKLTLFQDVQGVGEVITTRKTVYSSELYARGFRLKTMPDRRAAPKISSLKTLNYLGNITARREAQAEGFDEALFVSSDGTVLEGAVTNVFAVIGTSILTPAVGSGILPGILRGVILKEWRNPPIEESELTLPRLLQADEIFLTNSLMGVMPVSLVDRRSFDLSRNPVTQAVRSSCQAAELRSADPRTPII